MSGETDRASTGARARFRHSRDRALPADDSPLTPPAMPKLLVLFDARSDALTPLADAVAEGARGVRFAEVDVRHACVASSGWGGGDDVGEGAPRVGRYRALESPEALGAYDCIVVGVEAGRGAEADPVRALLAGGAVNLRNKVASAFTAATGEQRRDALWSVLTPMADRGMILVPPALIDTGVDDVDSARQLGKRVYDITGWITHARSHHHH
jgi:hypothetical protein